MNEHDILIEWLQIAYADYDSALYLFQKPHKKPLEIICYHCQQSAKKSLKAFLYVKGVEIPRTHETGILCQKCVEINNSFSILLKSCEELAIYATETRYPIRIEIDEETAERNLKQAFKVYNFVTNIINSSALEIQIQRLTPSLADDYAHFFDVVPHGEDTPKNNLPCYCVTWRTDDTYTGDGDHWYSTREERRERAIQFIKAGSLQGYLAYRGDDVVGWCNANADCQGCVNYLRSFYPIAEYCADVKVKSIFCFVITPEAQRTGVATKLVERVCQDAAAEGFDFVEAYPNKVYSPSDCWWGPLTMYEKCGFNIQAEQEGKVVVRKALKQ